MDLAAAIEKNRYALLRIVAYWLIAASVFTGHNNKNKLLPRRLGLWLSKLIGKIEFATDHLIIAASYVLFPKSQAHTATSKATLPNLNDLGNHTKPVTTFALVRRLKIIRQKLSRLAFYAQRRHMRRTSPKTATMCKSCDRADVYLKPPRAKSPSFLEFTFNQSRRHKLT
ncbi:MAG: hypothetical protein U5K75_06070 [Ahrensia sp.]|nr:hypothetical protein [Ahrensia sp.]